MAHIQPQPIAIWNSARDVWETPQTEGLFCEHLDVYSETFPTSGMTVNGVAYELPTWEPAMDVSASSSLLLTPVASEGEKATFQQGTAQRAMTGQPFLTNQIRDVYDLNEPRLLKTPTSQLAVNGGSQHPDKRKAGGHGPTLADEVEHLLPTPQAHDAQKGKTAEQVAAMRARGHGVSNLNELAENELVKLLPTPMTAYTSRDAETWLDQRPAGNGQRRTIISDLRIVVEEVLPTGATMRQPSAAGKQLWEDIPLPLPNPLDGMADIA